MFKARLGALGYEVVEVNLLREAIPADAALVAVVGPKAPFNADEAAKLKAAVDGGKPLLAVVGGPESPGREDRPRRPAPVVQPRDRSSVIVDPLLNYRGQLAVIYAPIVGPIHHPIVDSLTNRAVLMPRCVADHDPHGGLRPDPGTVVQPDGPRRRPSCGRATRGLGREPTSTTKKFERNENEHARPADRRRRGDRPAEARQPARRRNRGWSSSPAGTWPTTCSWSRSRPTSTC